MKKILFYLFIFITALASEGALAVRFDHLKFKSCLRDQLKDIQKQYEGHTLHVSVHYYWSQEKVKKYLYHELHIVGIEDSFSSPWMALYEFDWRSCRLRTIAQANLLDFKSYMYRLLSKDKRFCQIHSLSHDIYAVNLPVNYPDDFIFQDTYRVERKGENWSVHRKKHNQYCGGESSVFALRELKKDFTVSCSANLPGFCNIDY